MKYLIVMPISLHKIFTLEQTLDQLAIDSITCRNIEDIQNLQVGEYILIQDQYVVIRIE